MMVDPFRDIRKELVDAGVITAEEAASMDPMELITKFKDYKTGHILTVSASPRSSRPKQDARPREGLAYALEKLTTVAKGGNYCMTVVDGCWVNFRYKKRGDKLYFQVSGDKYIPSKSHLKTEHVKLLEEMGIEAEPMSDDIFSRHFNDVPRNFPEIVDMVFTIFEKVYRVDADSDAYIEFVLGNNLSEFSDELEELTEYIPKRRKEKKFYWDWNE